MGGVADGAHVGRGALRADELDGRRAHVHHQRVDQLDVVPIARLLPTAGSGGSSAGVGEQEVVPELAEEADGRPVLEVAVQVLWFNFNISRESNFVMKQIKCGTIYRTEHSVCCLRDVLLN